MRRTNRRHAVGLCAAALVLLAGLGGCASIPRESVELSRQIGVGIGQSRDAHLAMLDAFYQRMKADNDDWIAGTFYPRAVERTREALSAACAAAAQPAPDCATLTEKDLQQVMQETIAFRDELQSALENNRDDVFRVVNAHYSDLQQANAGITGLLASAVDVKEATREASATAAGITGLNIQPDQIERILDGFLQKAGSAGARVSDLEQQLADLLEKFRQKMEQ